MKGFYRWLESLSGRVVFTVSGADCAALLRRCAVEGITVTDGKAPDAFSLVFTVAYKDWARLRRLAEKCQCTVTRSRRSGLIGGIRRHKARLPLLIVMAALLGLLLWSKAYIWEIEVTGNETVPTGKILDVLEQCGVGIGSYWPAFTSDNLRSEAIVRLPELSWLTVNVRGSRATVLVRERIPKPEMIDGGAPCDIVAKRTGFVTGILALAGEARVRRGQTVSAGQVLISGLEQSRPLRAYGQVRGRTYYELSAVCPRTEAEKLYSGKVSTRWALRIGKTRLNLYRDEALHDAPCEKRFESYDLAVDGLFTLPLGLEREQRLYYDTTPRQTGQSAAKSALEARLHALLLEEIGDGEILSEHYGISRDEGCFRVCLRAECAEELGRVSVWETD